MRYIDIVLDGEIPNARFVEIERNGKSVRIGELIEREDGKWAIRLKDRWSVFREYPDWISVAQLIAMTPEQIDFEFDKFVRQLWKDGKL